MSRRQYFHWAFILILLNSIVFCLLQLNNLGTINLPTVADLGFSGSSFIWFYLVITTIGQMSLLALIAMLITLVGIALWPRSYLIPLAIILNSLMLIFLIVDSYCYHQYRFHIHGVILHMIFNHDNDQIFAPSRQEQWLVFSGIFGVVLLQILLAIAALKLTAKDKLIRYRSLLVSSIFACILLSYFSYFFANTINHDNYGVMHVFNEVALKARAFPLYDDIALGITPKDFNLRNVALRGSSFVDQPKQATHTLDYPKQAIYCSPPKKPLNLLIVMLDSWRFDMVTPDATPNIYQIAKHSLEFHHHDSGGNCTRPGVFSFFYGLPASYWSSMLRQQTAPVLVQQFLKAGYQPAIFSSATMRSPAFNKTVFSDVRPLKVETPGKFPYLRDEKITTEMLDFLNNRQQSNKPFFGFLFYNTTHSYCAPFKFKAHFKPYIPRCNRFGLTANTNRTPYFNRYKNALHFDDGLVGKVISLLKKKNLWQKTVVIFTGDHGQQFNDNHLNYWGHASNYTKYQVETPLIIHWPGKAKRIFSYQTSHFDMAPTLLQQLLNCKSPASSYSVGHSLFKKHKTPFLLIGSYVGYGILLPKRVIRILPSGQYQLESNKAAPLADGKLPANILASVFRQMREFYQR